MLHSYNYFGNVTPDTVYGTVPMNWFHFKCELNTSRQMNKNYFDGKAVMFRCTNESLYQTELKSKATYFSVLKPSGGDLHLLVHRKASLTNQTAHRNHKCGEYQKLSVSVCLWHILFIHQFIITVIHHRLCSCLPCTIWWYIIYTADIMLSCYEGVGHKR